MNGQPWTMWTELLCLSGILIPAAIVDFRTRIIPNKFPILLAAAKGFLLLTDFVLVWKAHGGRPQLSFFSKTGLAETGLGLLAAAAVTGICFLAVKNGIGLGDVKLLLAVGLFQGIGVFLRALALTSAAALGAAVVRIAIKKYSRDDRMPFAPFVAAGAIGSQLISIIFE